MIDCLFSKITVHGPWCSSVSGGTKYCRTSSTNSSRVSSAQRWSEGKNSTPTSPRKVRIFFFFLVRGASPPCRLRHFGTPVFFFLTSVKRKQSNAMVESTVVFEQKTLFHSLLFRTLSWQEAHDGWEDKILETLKYSNFPSTLFLSLSLSLSSCHWN
jgi:hypothetical protein